MRRLANQDGSGPKHMKPFRRASTKDGCGAQTVATEASIRNWVSVISVKFQIAGVVSYGKPTNDYARD